MKKIFLQGTFIIVLVLTSLDASSQLIKDEFVSVSFSDQFNDDKDNWRNMSTSDNLFMIQEGEYVLRRKNPSSGYSIFPKWKNNLVSFSLTAAMKLEDSKSPEASIGLIFMAQEDASGAFVFEINPKGQYRLKQLVGLSYKLLTGDVKTSGWVDSDALNKSGEYNIIEIKTARRNYDIYVNDKYLLSFTEIAYKSGDIGISIGAGTKAKVDYIIVKEPLSEAARSSATEALSTAGMNSPGVSDSAEVIIKLSEQVSMLKVENQSLRDTILILKRKLKTSRAEPNTESK
jgi:hypothetical protein